MRLAPLTLPAPAAVHPEPSREPRPLGCDEEGDGGSKQNDTDDTHAPKDIAAGACETGGMARSLLGVLLVTIALSAAGCGGGRHKSHEPAQTTVVRVFRLRHGLLHAELARAPGARATPAAAAAALGIEAQTTVQDGTARVEAEKLPPGRVAELVYTLTQFPSVRRVDVAGRSGLDREDVAAFVPVILIESPADGARVPATFRVQGTASVFEATLVVELRRAGATLDHRTVTASEGAPERGSFSTRLRAPSGGPATVVAFAPSAADGSPQHVQTVPLSVG